MQVEFAAGTHGANAEGLRICINEKPAGKLVLDWRPMIEALLERRIHEPVPSLAAAFHETLACAMTSVAQRIGVGTIVQTGGSFQNARLLESTTERLFPWLGTMVPIVHAFSQAFAAVGDQRPTGKPGIARRSRYRRQRRVHFGPSRTSVP